MVSIWGILIWAFMSHQSYWIIIYLISPKWSRLTFSSFLFVKKNVDKQMSQMFHIGSSTHVCTHTLPDCTIPRSLLDGPFVRNTLASFFYSLAYFSDRWWNLIVFPQLSIYFFETPSLIPLHIDPSLTSNHTRKLRTHILNLFLHCISYTVGSYVFVSLLDCEPHETGDHAWNDYFSTLCAFHSVKESAMERGSMDIWWVNKIAEMNEKNTYRGQWPEDPPCRAFL